MDQIQEVHYLQTIRYRALLRLLGRIEVVIAADVVEEFLDGEG